MGVGVGVGGACNSFKKAFSYFTSPIALIVRYCRKGNALHFQLYFLVAPPSHLFQKHVHVVFLWLSEVPRVKDNNPLGTQKNVLLDFDWMIYFSLE